MQACHDGGHSACSLHSACWQTTPSDHLRCLQGLLVLTQLSAPSLPWHQYAWTGLHKHMCMYCAERSAAELLGSADMTKAPHSACGVSSQQLAYIVSLYVQQSSLGGLLHAGALSKLQNVAPAPWCTPGSQAVQMDSHRLQGSSAAPSAECSSQPPWCCCRCQQAQRIGSTQPQEPPAPLMQSQPRLRARCHPCTSCQPAPAQPMVMH